MVNPVTVPNFSQYNFAIGDTTEVVTKQNGVNAALQQFGNSLNVSIDQFNDDVEFVDTARQELDTDNIVHAPGSGLQNEAGTAYSSDMGTAGSQIRTNQQNDGRYARTAVANTFSRGNVFSLGSGTLSMDQADWDADANLSVNGQFTSYINRNGSASEGWLWRSHEGGSGGLGGVTAASLTPEGDLLVSGGVVARAAGTSGNSAGFTSNFLRLEGASQSASNINTGIYYNTTGTGDHNVSIAVDGTARLRMDTEGNNSFLGDLSVSGRLEAGSGVYIGTASGASSVGYGLYQYDGEIRFALDGSRAIDITPDGLHVRGNLTMSGGMSASNLTSGTLPAARLPNHSANLLTTGTLPAARIGNSAITSARLTASERMTTSNVLGAIAGVRRGDVGYTGYMRNDLADISLHSTRAGSGLSFAFWDSDGTLTNYSTTPQGTWRILGSVASGESNRNQAHQWVRIS